MTVAVTAGRCFLLLQGPPGPFFWQLGAELRAQGARVLRIDLNGGDQHDWPRQDAPGPATRYRGRPGDWARFVDRFLGEHGVTDVVLFGDCRPMHIAAHRMARPRGIRVHVFEEGYIRPNWLTLERDGVNGHSRLPRDPNVLRAEARGLTLPAPLPPIGASMRRRVRDTLTYFTFYCLGRLSFRYPHYRSHRPGSILIEGLGWLAKMQGRRRAAREAESALRSIAGQPYFLFPLQLSADYQIRTHSAFDSMHDAVDHVLASFAGHAPAGTLLVVKAHPLDSSPRGWRRFVQGRARRFGLLDRLVFIDGGDLQTLAENALGMVVVNSTSATFALAVGTPVMALSRAVYAVPGITHQGPIDGFWSAPEPPDRSLYHDFQCVLHARCLVRGGLASESATRILVENASRRLLADAD